MFSAKNKMTIKMCILIYVCCCFARALFCVSVHVRMCSWKQKRSLSSQSSLTIFDQVFLTVVRFCDRTCLFQLHWYIYIFMYVFVGIRARNDDNFDEKAEWSKLMRCWFLHSRADPYGPQSPLFETLIQIDFNCTPENMS